MKVAKLLKGLFIPFLIFIFVGSLCPDPDEVDPKKCEAYATTYKRIYKLNENSSKSIEVKTPPVEARCKARFYVVFGWQVKDKFTDKSESSPIQNNFGGLKLTLGETYNGKTFLTPSAIQTTGTSPYDGSSGHLWIIDKPLSSVNSSGTTQLYVKIEHDILDEDFNFFVEVTIEYSDAF
jgi:hypothetical protein